MVKKVYIASDVHEDLHALERFADYAQAQKGDMILIPGDLGYKHFNATQLHELAKDEYVRHVLFEKQRPTQFDLEGLMRRESVQKFITLRRINAKGVLEGTKEILDSTGIPYKVLNGNYDNFDDIDSVFGPEFGDGRFNIFDASAFGYGGANAVPQHIALLRKLGEIDYFDGNHARIELMKNPADILFTHDPPHGFLDVFKVRGESGELEERHGGLGSATIYIDQFAPKIALCGHFHKGGIETHQNPRNGKKTVVLNPGNLGRADFIDLQTMEERGVSQGQNKPFGHFMELEMVEDGTPLSVRRYTCQDESGNRNISKSIRLTDEQSFERESPIISVPVSSPEPVSRPEPVIQPVPTTMSQTPITEETISISDDALAKMRADLASRHSK